MEARGLDPGVPKAAVSAESYRLYRSIVDDLSALFATWELEPAHPVLVPGDARSGPAPN
jgi:hypothetical protein